MANIICPKCGVAAEGGPGFVGISKPFCSRCGWNVESAAQIQRENFSMYKWGMPILIAFVLVACIFPRNGLDKTIPLLFLLAVGSRMFFDWRKLKRLESLCSSVGRTYPPISFVRIPHGGKPEAILCDQFQPLLNLSKPRRVGFKFIPGFVIVILPFFSVAMGYFALQSVRDSVRLGPLSADLIISVFLSLLFSTIGLVLFRDAFKDRKLMTEGNATIATITFQYLSGNKHSTSKITYEFKDEAGQSILGEGRDDSTTLYEDMKVLVFYKPEDPNVNIPICGSNCKLKES